MKQACVVIAFCVPVQGGDAIRCAHAGERFEPGLWQSTAFIDGKKGRATGPRCITVQEAKSMNGSATTIRGELAADPAWQGCTIGEIRVEEMQVDFTVACAGGSVTTSRTTYQGTSYDGTITVSHPGASALVMSIKGERTGSCP